MKKSNKAVKSEMMHFTIDGEWFTWILRHLWIEGNQMKAVKMWTAAFPEYGSEKYLKTLFIDLVSGRKKFTGDSSGTGFGYEDDGTKYWSSVAGGKPSKEWPLLDSWDDVIRLKKAQLFLKELELRSYRLNRKHPDNFGDCSFNTLEWSKGTDENRIENTIRNSINELYTDVRNLSIQLLVDVELEQLPNESALLRAGSGLSSPTEKDIDNKVQRKNLTAFDEVKAKLDAVKDYFETKYGQRIFHYNLQELKYMYSFEDKVYTVEESRRKVPVAGYAQNIMNNASLMLGIKVPDVDTYIQSMIEESHREKIEAEDAKTTKYTSGYISPDGDFFGCTDLLHSQFSDKIAEKMFGLEEGEDGQKFLDKKGWVKISMNRFFYLEKHKPTQSQLDTIFDYMVGKKLDKAMFNTSVPSMAKTFTEQFTKGE
jgi:hypothetical protein